MSTRQVRKGRKVRLVDPLRVATMFHRPGVGGVVGAGGVIVERRLLDTPATVMAYSAARRRVLVGWPVRIRVFFISRTEIAQYRQRDRELVARGATGLWLNSEQIEAA